MNPRLFAAALVLILSLPILVGADSKHEMTSPSNPAFDRLKTLVGTWETTDEDGKAAVVSYDLVSGGSALLEKIGPSSEPAMVSMYAVDGPTVLMTHYCGVGNQPRMRTPGTKVDSKTMEFSYVDCANLSARDAGHMHHLLFRFEDQDHFTEEWTWREKGKEQKTVFHLARKKSS